jgi:hypothetical protein
MFFVALLAIILGLLALQYFVLAPREAQRQNKKAIERTIRQQIIDIDTEKKIAAQLLKEAGQ